MDLTHKQGAVIWTGVLAIVFLGLLGWYMVSSPAPIVPIADTTATSTAPFVEPEPQMVTENGTYYEITAEYPAQTPLLEGDAAAIARIRHYIDERIAEFKTNGDFENLTAEDVALQGLGGERKYVLGLEYELYTGSSTASYVYTIYEDTLGAHPNAYFRTFTFDLSTGAELSLGDLFVPGSTYLSWLSDRTRRDIPHIVQQRSGYLPDAEYLASGTEPSPESFQSFYLDAENFVVAFPPYQVGPYALGSILVSIPLRDMAGILAPQSR